MCAHRACILHARVTSSVLAWADQLYLLSLPPLLSRSPPRSPRTVGAGATTSQHPPLHLQHSPRAQSPRSYHQQGPPPQAFSTQPAMPPRPARPATLSPGYTQVHGHGHYPSPIPPRPPAAPSAQQSQLKQQQHHHHHPHNQPQQQQQQRAQQSAQPPQQELHEMPPTNRPPRFLSMPVPPPSIFAKSYTLACVSR